MTTLLSRRLVFAAAITGVAGFGPAAEVPVGRAALSAMGAISIKGHYVHSEPTLPLIPAGEALQVTGRLYFSERGMPAIAKRFETDMANGVLHSKLIP